MTSSPYPSIVVANGVEAGTVLTIDEVLNNFALGSDDGCHLVLTGDAVSPMHASVFLDDEGVVTLTDTNSRGGVFVNGLRIMEQALSDGDQISLGPPDDPQSGLLRFSAQGAEEPLFDLSSVATEGLPGLEGLEPPVEEALLTSELGRPSYGPTSEAGALPDFSLPGLEDEAAPAEEFAAPETEAADEDVTPPQAPPAARPAAVSAAARKAAPKKSSSGDSDDPLAGLAESLGAGDRVAPPPPVAPAAATPSAKKKKVAPAVMAARVGAIAVLLAVFAWFGLRRYSDSIVVPVVDTFVPVAAEPGQTVTINGSGFATESGASEVKVLVGSTEVKVLDVNPTRINIMIPESLAEAGSQTLPVKVTAQGSASTSRLLKISVTPKIASLSPRVALTGDEVEITGKWFASPKIKATVTVAGADAEVLEATASKIRVKVPVVTATEGQRVSVKVAVGPDVSKEGLLNYGRLPFVESVTPARALPGDVVTVAGLGLTSPDVAVTLNGKKAAILSETETELKVSVPGLRLTESAGRRDLIVSAQQKMSISHPLEILRESSALYAPRFFVEMVAGLRPAISCELGPVMLLGDDIPSRKRAHETAAVLNRLVVSGRASRVQFVAGDLVISSSGTPVLAVGPGDGSGNPRALASVWAAQLNDIFDLFLLGRRPGRTVELSPEGRVFVDIFAAARRRSSEAGVSQGILSSPDPAWLRSLASLAAGPTFGSGQALALVDGFWAGVIEVPGAIQPRKIEISLTATPSGLFGQRTSRQGRLSSDVSLQNLSYGRHELRFSFIDSGENLNYLGRLDGDEIDGTVTRANGSKVGRLVFKITR